MREGMRQAGAAFVAAMTVAGTAWPAGDDRIAVAEFRADGVPEALALQVAELLAIELAKFEGVDVVTPTDLRAMLDHTAHQQLLGCTEPACYVDLSAALPSQRLLAGSVGRVGELTFVHASLVDVRAGTVLARVSQPLGADAEAIVAGVKTLALVLLTGDPRRAPGDLVVKGEVTADMVERVRVAQRERGLAVHLRGGALMAASAAASSKVPPSNLGGTGHVELSVPLWPWLHVVAAGGLGYYTGDVAYTTSYQRVDTSAGTAGQATGVISGAFGVADCWGLAGLKLKRPYGLVLPYASAGITGDWLILDISDLTYRQDDSSTIDPPEDFTRPVPFRQSMAPGVGFRVGPGVEFAITEHLSASAELALYGKLHGLEKIAQVSNVEQRTPFPPLLGTELVLGVAYQL